MLRRIASPVLAIIYLAAAAVPCAGWGMGAHLYIAEHSLPAFANQDLTNQALYGAMLPDLDSSYMALNNKNVVMVRELTHQATCNLLPPRAGSDSTLRALAAGWLTHNEVWGADHYAHKANPLVPGATSGYVQSKASALPELSSETAHEYIETAIDLLVKRNLDRRLGNKVMRAARERRSTVAGLLAATYSPPAFPDTIGRAEDIFRGSTLAYGQTLALKGSLDKYVIAAGLSAMHRIGFGRSLRYLERAISACTPDYRTAIEDTIASVSAGYAAEIKQQAINAQPAAKEQPTDGPSN